MTLLKALDAKKSKVGDEVTAKVTRDLKDGDKVVISKNSKIVGHLTDVKAKSKDQAQSQIAIIFERAVLKDGGEIPITVVIQALAKPADDRSGGMSDLMRGTGANQTVAGTANNVAGAGVASTLVSADVFVSDVRAALADFSQIFTAEFRVTQIDGQKARVRYEFVGTGAGFYREQRIGEFSVEWENDYRFTRWELLGEVRSRSHGECFRDIQPARIGE